MIRMPELPNMEYEKGIVFIYTLSYQKTKASFAQFC